MPVRPKDCPKKVLLLSAPSTWRLLSVPFCPPTARSPCRVGSRTTLGVNVAKSRKLRPLTGRFWMARSFTTEEIEVRVVSTTWPSAETSTIDTVVLPTASWISSGVWPPTVTIAFVKVAGTKPCAPLVSTL